MNEEAGLKSVNISLPGSGSNGSVKKKPKFKSTVQPQNGNVVPAKPLDVERKKGSDANDLNKAVANGWADDQYDPAKIMKYDDDDDFKLEDILTEEELRDVNEEIADRKYQ